MPVELALPRFGDGGALRLRELVISLGMRRAFTPRAELRGIAGEPLLVGDVVHRSLVRVDEAGTEAAAATAVSVPRGGRSPSPAIPFVADQPFPVRGGGEIPFMGRMTDPTAGGG